MGDNRGSDRRIRFLSKILKPIGLDGCWVWTGPRGPRGYGYFSLGKRTEGSARAHRFSWELHNGPIPAGLFVCHRCDNTGCVRPDHLFLGTAADNTADMIRKGRKIGPNGETHPMAKFTSAGVRKVRALVASGMSQKDVARHYGAAQATISAIISRKAWKGVQ